MTELKLIEGEFELEGKGAGCILLSVNPRGAVFQIGHHGRVLSKGKFKDDVETTIHGKVRVLKKGWIEVDFLPAAYIEEVKG